VIRYELWPPRKTGGQQVSRIDNGVKGVHEVDGAPTGLEACCNLHRSQFKNREAVREMIEWAPSSASIALPDS
jgi:protein subunit release factor A